METNEILECYGANHPFVATAIHDGHNMRQEVEDLIAISEKDRLREEDPYTARLANIGKTKIIGLKSRFEVDLNRPREKAIYINAEDAWGLNVWKNKPAQEVINRSLEEYDAFYSKVFRIFSKLRSQFGKFIVFDLHSYNYLRDGENGPQADPKDNPEVNIGTGTINRLRWGKLVDRFITDLGSYTFQSGHLDVRENVKFKGGHFSKWTHEEFPNSACVISIEFKKFFMNEWTGELDENQLNEIILALKSTIPGVMEELRKIK